MKGVPIAGTGPILEYKTVRRALRATIGVSGQVHLMSQHVTNALLAVKYVTHMENALAALKDIISMNIRVAQTTVQRALRCLSVQHV